LPAIVVNNFRILLESLNSKISTIALIAKIKIRINRYVLRYFDDTSSFDSVRGVDLPSAGLFLCRQFMIVFTRSNPCIM